MEPVRPVWLVPSPPGSDLSLASGPAGRRRARWCSTPSWPATRRCRPTRSMPARSSPSPTRTSAITASLPTTRAASPSAGASSYPSSPTGPAQLDGCRSSGHYGHIDNPAGKPERQALAITVSLGCASKRERAGGVLVARPLRSKGRFHPGGPLPADNHRLDAKVGIEDYEVRLFARLDRAHLVA